jgi:outer membrane autotransporter protein
LDVRAYRQSQRARLRAALLACSALTAAPAAAQDATWNGATVQWTTAANWLPPSVPAGVATFNGGGSAKVTISSNAAIAQIDFTSATLYALKITGAALFQVTGAGITGGGTAPAFTNLGGFQFSNAATAGGADITNRNGGETTFLDATTAANATITNRDFSATNFFSTATVDHSSIVNNGGTTYFFDQSTAANGDLTNRNFGATVFGTAGGIDTATAGNATITNRPTGGETVFQAFTTAGAATVVNNGGSTYFFDSSNAGTASITNKNGGLTLFADQASAAGATIDNRDGCFCTPSLTVFMGASDAGTATITNQNIGAVLFVDGATAANAVIINNADGATVFGTQGFTDAPTAGNATITNNAGGVTQFQAFSTAGSARIITNDGGAVGLFDNATGGNAQFITNAGGIADFSQTAGPAGDGKITAGSIAGAGDYYLGGNQLTVGGNNLSTEVSGTVNDGPSPLQCGCAPATTGASIVKIGSGTLTLSGTNTYSGGTTLIGGTLSVSQDANLGGPSGPLNFDGGILQVTGTSFTSLARAITWGAVGGGFDIADAANTFTAGPLLGAGGALTKLGAGRLVLTGTNTYTGGTTLVGGGLSISNNANLGTGSLAMLNATTLTFTNSFTFSHPVTVAGDPTFNVLSGSTVNMSAPITDGAMAGDLVKAGAGTLILSAANSYSGGTTISAGTLQLGNGGATGSIIGDVLDNGTLAFNHSNSLTFGGTISGSGAVQQNGTGTLILSGNNTYTAGTTISAGTLQLGDGGTSGSILGDVLDNGTLAFNRSDAVTFGGVISGTGAVQQNGAGTTILSGTNTYTGLTIINAGMLAIAPTGSIASNVTNNAFFVNAGLVAGSLTNNAGAASNTGTITGAATINGGFLGNDGTIKGVVTVNAGGTLGGNGTIGGAIINGGTLSPGHSIGAITVNGNLSFIGLGNYIVEVSPTAADKTIVTGSATLAGTVSALFGPGLYAQQHYNVLSASGGLSGTFSNLAVTNAPAYLTASLSYTATDVFLNLTSGIAQLTGLTANQRATGGAIDTAFNGGSLPAGLDALFGLSIAAMPRAIDQLSGEVHASTAGVLMDESLYVRSAVLGRLRQASYGGDAATAALSAGGPQLALAEEALTTLLAYGAKSPLPVKAPLTAPAPSRDVAFWAQGFGAWGKFDGDGNAATVRRDLAGFFSGVDARFGDGRGGIAAGYTSSRNHLDGRGSANVDSGHLAGYGGWSFGAFNLRGGAAYAWHTIDTGRTVALPGFFDAPTGHYNGGTGQIFGEAGYGIALGKIAVEPFAGAAWVHLRTDPFDERGGTAALRVAASAFEVGYSTLGIRAASVVPLWWDMVLVPRVSAAWQHAFGEVTPNATLAFQGAGAPFVIAGVPIARDSLLSEAGLDLVVSRNATLGISYTGQLARNVQDHAAKGKFTWKF